MTRLADLAGLPASRVPDPREAPALRWGVVGTGWIAERFVAALQRLTAQRVVAVGSRSTESAREFAGRFGIAHAHGSYEALVGDPEVDVVYVATPHNFHRPHALLALEAGKHVLVEKPVALNAAEAQEIANVAAARGLFCAEALWSLFTPKLDVVRQVLDAGLLGDITAVVADNGEWFDAEHRIQRHDLAGGPLLDLGTYPFSFAHWVLGTPDEVVARGTDAPSGVNGQIATLLAWGENARGVVHTTILANTPVSFVVAGSEATLTIPGVFYRPGPFSVVGTDGRHLAYDEPPIAYDALAYQAAEVARRVTAGETSTPVRPMADSIATMALMDEVRRQIGQVWEAER
ncbi:Gfo/Idh/MocA family protein [Microlunatus flavus]|uniref:Predicted dehydrogenase n=1 Tax=Microlunatus flavus TaxID=1036181 RepID=A0A1H9KV42_9ACTN|nr:Gfo/Idh/MocA family oxidoreductase [Microlunatus flavus]SER03062.1 Predicted dehydrogenase [Microlunatus flavus]